MKAFEIPMVEVVLFGKSDVIVTSDCYCVECGECVGYDCRKIDEFA